ncbi:major capsid protein [Lactococcus phage Q54]|uniref:Major capsid protein n=1 Tax=Lactococcus phage Q54 TaxID=382685 RepID=Q0GXV1_9CAUD|nr:head maturation protease [Lactococcus phage Q54]ABF22575.1 major capsid protein [Lactococcus phage Q54]
MSGTFKDGVLIGKLVDYGSIDSYNTVFEPGAFDEYVGSEQTFNLDYRHDMQDKLAKFKVIGREDGIYIEAKPNNDIAYKRMKEAIDKGAGLSVTFQPVEASEVDGVAYYKKCILAGGALTPNPSNKNAVVTYFREEKKKEENKMTFDQNLMQELLDAKKLAADLNAKLKERENGGDNAALKTVSELAANLMKQRESEKILGVEALKVTPEATEFLKTREAEVAYMSASLTKDPKAAWTAELKERGISGMPAPAGILKRIQDAVNDEGSLLPFIRHENLPTLVVGGDNALTQGTGHTTGTDKTESNITLQTRVLTPQYVYKYIKLPKIVMNSNATDIAGAILTYVMNRLPDMVIMAVNRAIIMGGVTGVSETQIYPVVGDAWATNVTGTTNIQELLEKLSVATPKAADSTLVIHRNDLAAIRFLKDKNGNYVFPVGVSNQTIATHFGFNRLVQSVAVDEKTAVSLSGYVTNGSRGMEFEQGTILVENNKEYLFEMPISGSLEYKGTTAYGTYTPPVAG